MKKPELEVIMWKLRTVDFKEWEVFTNLETHYGPYFELKRYGLLFRSEIRKYGSSPQYVLSIEDDDKTFRLEYLRSGEEAEKVYKFYQGMKKDIEQHQEKEAAEKLGFLLSDEEKGESDLEHIISRLKKFDTQAWRPDTFFNKGSKYPALTIKDSGVTFCIKKKLWITGWKYGLEAKYEKDSTKKVKYTQPDKKQVKRLIGELYEKVYKELKEGKEKEFEGKLNSFLTN